jgi:transcription antitermination factor NusG
VADWLVARTQTNGERKVEFMLERRGVETYAPRFRASVLDRRTRRRRFVIRSLFPNYVFVKSSTFYFLLEISGISGILMHGCAPAQSDVLDSEILRLRSSEDRNGFVAQPLIEKKFKFRKGDNIRVLKGILTDRIGKCDHYDDDLVVVSLNMLGRKVGLKFSEFELAAA